MQQQKAILDTFSIPVNPKAIGNTKKSIIDTHNQAHKERGLKHVKHIQAAEMVNGGLRKKVRRGCKNTVPEDHSEGLAYWIKCMGLLKFKVLLFMVIQWLVYISKGDVYLWLEKIKYGVPSIKWAKDFVEDHQWGLTEEKMRLLDITR